MLPVSTVTVLPKTIALRLSLERMPNACFFSGASIPASLMIWGELLPFKMVTVSPSVMPMIRPSRVSAWPQWPSGGPGLAAISSALISPQKSCFAASGLDSAAGGVSGFYERGDRRFAAVSNPFVVVNEASINSMDVDRRCLELLQIEGRSHSIKEFFAQVGW